MYIQIDNIRAHGTNPLIIPLFNFPFAWPPSLVLKSLSLTWSPSFVCGAIPVHSGPRLLVNWPPPSLSLPILPFPFPNGFPSPIMCPSTTTSRHRLHIVQYTYFHCLSSPNTVCEMKPHTYSMQNSQTELVHIQLRRESKLRVSFPNTQFTLKSNILAIHICIQNNLRIWIRGTIGYFLWKKVNNLLQVYFLKKAGLAHQNLCKPVLQCRLSKGTFSSGKPQGVGILEWGGNREGMEMGRSVYEQPGTKVDRILSQQGGFPSK